MSMRPSDTEVVYEDPTQYLSASISSLSSQRAQTSWIAKQYRHATQLFLTRRLSEALDAIAPLVEASDGDGRGSPIEQDGTSIAPVATSSKGTRVKVWSFYSTLLDAIIQLEPDEGKLAFGEPRYSSIVAQVREGTIWDHVVRLGYRGAEGTVDGEVVANLSTLLLSHMASQKLNQAKLESYLAASAMPVFDFTHMTSPHETRSELPRSRSGDGTSTPRDLNTRLKIIELYTLHILPRNAEWDYARDFIGMSEVLDDERREAFQHALQSLREEQSHEALRQSELRKRAQAEEAERESAAQEKQRALQEQRATELQAQHERDMMHSSRTQRPASRQRASTTGSTISAKERKTPRSAAKPPPDHLRHGRPPPSATRPDPKGTNTLYGRATAILAVMRTSLAGRNMKLPASLLRLLLFLMAFAFALARRDVRDTTRRLMHLAFQKVRETVGMGLRVSYI